MIQSLIRLWQESIIRINNRVVLRTLIKVRRIIVMNKDLKVLISQMTLEEKASLCSGADSWNLKSIDRLGIPSIMVTDGPHGLRKQADNHENVSDEPGVPATCFPSGAALASSWDRELVKEVGRALGTTCQAEKVSILLGPAVNIKRSPLCGRNFEYLSEDPLLTGEIAAAFIEGVQSQGVGTSLKHYALNNQEHRRMSTSSDVDERALREIYLTGFEIAVKKAQPWTLMCSYNKVNGTYASQNKYLLTDILKNEWRHEGFVMSDWGAVRDRAAGVAAGLELEMPGNGGLNDKKIVEAVKNGTLDEKTLDESIERILKIVVKAVDNQRQTISYDKTEQHRLARKVAGECAILLKNEDDILPLKRAGKIAIIGDFAQNPRYQGGGSSHINPTQIDNPLEEILKLAGDAAIEYATGFNSDDDLISKNLFEEALQKASKADFVIVFAGLPDSYESEGYDREHLNLPPIQNQLIEAISKVHTHTIVVLSNGAPVEMPWANSVKAILEVYLGGQAMGGAVADLLFGIANPSGKLAETFPLKLQDNPSFINFPGVNDNVKYSESIFVGYRYYDKVKRDVLFPFGHGLSYATFGYKDICINKNEIEDTETVKVAVKVINTGVVRGKEIVQLYVTTPGMTVISPEKELKAFYKIMLEPGEENTVEFILDKRAFAYYNEDIRDWHVEGGEYQILVGSSSRNIKLSKTIKINSTIPILKMLTVDSTFSDLIACPEGQELAKKFKSMILGDEKDQTTKEKKSNGLNLDRMIYDFPISTMISFGRGVITAEEVDITLNKINKNMLKNTL
jgi:beta-glucosidase